MPEWECGRLELDDPRPFPLGHCCQACPTRDVHGVLLPQD